MRRGVAFEQGRELLVDVGGGWVAGVQEASRPVANRRSGCWPATASAKDGSSSLGSEPWPHPADRNAGTNAPTGPQRNRETSHRKAVLCCQHQGKCWLRMQKAGAR
jgi:hypothetical protein